MIRKFNGKKNISEKLIGKYRTEKICQEKNWLNNYS